MSLRIYTNVSAMVAHNNLFNTNTMLQQSIERMSSGLRINHASDDAAGSAIVVHVNDQVEGLNMASQNTQDGVNMLNVIDGSLSQAQDILTRARTLAVQMSNGTYSASDRQYAQSEVTQLVCSLDQLSASANFNGINLLSGAPNLLTFQTGAYSGNNYGLAMTTVNSASLTLTTMSNVSSQTFASQAITVFDNANDFISQFRATYGAAQSRLQNQVSALNVTSNNLSSALSRIRDLDVAAETSNLTRLQIMQQAGTSVLGTANQSPQSVLSLLH